MSGHHQVFIREMPAAAAFGRALRLACWNALLLMAGLALIVIVGEVWIRLTTPFMTEGKTFTFVPKVGVLYEPHTEVRVTNRIDFWSASRANRWGFLDREPIGFERAAESCHVAMIGDSFVAAEHVPVSGKFHVRLEELAARQLPHLDVTTSAFGIAETGQIAQIPYYDEFARHLRPKLVVLVFVRNDFRDNVPLNPVKLRRHVSAQRGGDGALILRPPDPDYEFPEPGLARRLMNVARISWFAQWVDAKMDSTMGRLWRDPPEPVGFRDVQDFTGFALDRFKERADRDGASLAILASHTMRREEDGLFERLSAMAGERGIPVIGQHDHILRRGGSHKDARWTHDHHWSPTGHQWAAEALLEYLKQNQDVCG